MSVRSFLPPLVMLMVHNRKRFAVEVAGMGAEVPRAVVAVEAVGHSTLPAETSGAGIGAANPDAEVAKGLGAAVART